MTEAEQLAGTVLIAEKVMGMTVLKSDIFLPPHTVMTDRGQFCPWINPADALSVLDKLRENPKLQAEIYLLPSFIAFAWHAGEFSMTGKTFQEAVCLAALAICKEGK